MILARQVHELEQRDLRGEVVDKSMVDPIAYDWFLDRRIEVDPTTLEGKHVLIELAGVKSIDGQTKPGGTFHFQEFEDSEWTGGGYADEDDLAERVEEFFTDEYGVTYYQAANGKFYIYDL